MKQTYLFGLIAAGIAVVLMLVVPMREDESADPGPPTSADAVTPRQLSEWIVAGDQGYLLVDLRPEEAYLEDGIKTAISMPAATLDDEAIAQWPRHRRIVLYDEDGSRAKQVWRQVKPLRDRVDVLEGGFAGWRNEVLNPNAPADDAGEDAWQTYRRDVAVANYYLGKTDVVPQQRERAVRPVLRPRPAAGASEGC